jgi:hypothetical protein
MRTSIAFAAALLSFTAQLTPAAVADSSANGFTIKIPLHIEASPADAYRKFVGNVADWWNPRHTFSGSAKNLTIDAKAAGCFCEKLPDGGGVRHMEVVTVMPSKMIVMTGALGPMQALAVAGNMRVTFASDESGTKMEVTYAVVGYQPNGINSFAVPSDGMLTEQLTRFKNFVENGAPGK